MKWLAVAAVVLATLAPSAAAKQQQQRPWLWQCSGISNLEVQWNCYVGRLLAVIDASGNPAVELPKIDAKARESGTMLESMCHPLMHQVGREWAAQHHLTLARLMDYIPRSNDPTCSAGFGMGMVMYLGPQIILTGGKSALETCMKLPTRYRSYTCVHGIGHALMRGYHGRLRQAVVACKHLGEQAPDCAQGAFHDYWISLRGADGTVRRAHGDSPRFLCNGHLWYVRPCWYRYFVEDPLAPLFDDAASIRKACAGLHKLQRYGCVSAAALSIPESPFVQTRICVQLRGDAAACLRGVAVQALERSPAKQLALFRMCARMPRGETTDCRSWFGRTLVLVTDGRFRCPDRACRAGAAQIGKPLVTFS